MINMADFRDLCPHREFCGGCIYQDVPYEKQLEEKEREEFTRLKVIKRMKM